MSWRRRNKLLVALFTLSFALSAAMYFDAQAADNPKLMTKIDIQAPITFPSAENKIYNYVGDQINIRRILRDLGAMANMNIILDKSVEGSVSVSFNDVTVKEALEYLRSLASLYYMNKGDNIVLVTTKAEASAKGLNKNISKLIPIKYVNAKFVAILLNTTLYAAEAAGAGPADAAGAAGGSSQKATAEFRTNSIILVGTDNDIRLAEEMIAKIDIPRETRTFKINHADVVEVAQLLTATIFNDGVSPFNSSGASQAGGLPSAATDVSVNVETFQEGSGASNQVQGASGSSGGGQAQSFTLRKSQMATKEIKISPDGPIIVPDTRTSTLTIMGTIDQIALAESVIPTLDQKLPQVAIETSLIEIFERGVNELTTLMGNSSGQWATGFNNTSVNSSTLVGGNPAIPFNNNNTPITRNYIQNGQVMTQTYFPGTNFNVVGLPTVRTRAEEGFEAAWTTVPIERRTQTLAQLNAMLSHRKGKILANPTVIAVHNTEAIVSVTEEIIRRTTTTRDSTGFEQTTVEIGEAGIILNILPKVTGDSFVNLRIRPSVSTVAGTVRDASNNLVTLLNRRDLAAQEVRVANGHTLALGGLIQENELTAGSGMPFVSDLPIIGALFRTNYKDKTRTELIMLVTPRIMEDSNPVMTPAISSLMGSSNMRPKTANAISE